MTIEFSSAFSTHWQIHCVWCCVCGKRTREQTTESSNDHDRLVVRSETRPRNSNKKECRCGMTCASQMIRFVREQANWRIGTDMSREAAVLVDPDVGCFVTRM